MGEKCLKWPRSGWNFKDKKRTKSRQKERGRKEKGEKEKLLLKNKNKNKSKKRGIGKHSSGILYFTQSSNSGLITKMIKYKETKRVGFD